MTASPDPESQKSGPVFCLDACRLNHVFRAADCTGLRDPVSRASGALRIGLEGITGFPLHDNQWSQASLPTARGGFGISDPIQVCHVARLSAWGTWLSGGAVGLTLCPALRETLPRGHVDVISVFCSGLGDVGEPLSLWNAGGSYWSGVGGATGPRLPSMRRSPSGLTCWSRPNVTCWWPACQPETGPAWKSRITQKP